MPAKKRIKKKVINKRSTSRKLQNGKVAQKQLFIVIGVLVVLIGAVAIFKPWQYLGGNLPFTSKPIAVTKPVMDMGRARQMSIDPQKDSVMQIVTKEKVVITLEVPKGAVKDKTLIKLIPFYHDKKVEAPTAGVVVGPASINFTTPVTLSFNFSDSDFKNTAPKSVLDKKIRTTGLAHVMQIDKDATTLTPTLISRALETEKYLPARILNGGAYVYSLDGKDQVEIAKKALNTENMHTLTVMESATTLLFNDQKLSDVEMKKAKAAVGKILSQKEPPVAEFYAALVLQKKIKTPSFSFIPKAYAYSTDQGFFQIVCKQDGGTIEDYVGFAKAAELYGHDAEAKSCMDKAKNKVAEQVKEVLAGSPDLKTVKIALADVELLGLDEDTNLDEKLIEKLKEVATEDAKKVADDPTSDVVDAAIEMQKMEAVGADQGPTYEKLKQKVTDYLDQQESSVDQASEEYQKGEAGREAEMERLTKEVEEAEKKMEEEVAENSIDEEDFLYGQAMSALGIGMLQMFGFDKLDKESLQKKFDEMQAEAKEMVALGHAFCAEARADGIDVGDCEANMQKAEGMLKQAEEESYRVTAEIGNIQSKEFEEPEYLEENGDYTIYFEEEISPAPEEGSEVGEIAPEENQDESGIDYGAESQPLEDSSNYDQYDYSSTENTGDQTQSENNSSSEYDAGYESGAASGSDEAVEGVSTKRSEPFFWWPFR